MGTLAFPWTALLIGLWSSGHCVAMCGGLAMAAGHQSRLSLQAPVRQGIELLSWQLGRVLSYSLMGLIAGGFGAYFLQGLGMDLLRRLGMVVANLLLIGLGLHLTRWSSWILWLEALGQPIWRWVAPLAQRSLTPQAEGLIHPPRPLISKCSTALKAGALWGWLPCGLVYSMLITASVTGSPGTGALWMLAFGLGTIPALWTVSTASGRLLRSMQSDRVRVGIGIAIIGFGVWGLLRAFELIEVKWLDAFCITM
ncbi:MAG: hypothetical protein RLY67_784 [Pseudomonadota bacterium]